MRKKVVLGYPYAGAFYWLAAKENPYADYKGELKYRGSHPYYKTLFGDHTQEAINNCISLSILFKEIFIVGADAYLPIANDENDRVYTDDALGLSVYNDWDRMNDFRLNEAEVSHHLKDQVVGRILRRVPEDACGMILQQTLIQNFLASEFDASIIGNSSHLALSKRLYELHFEKSQSQLENQETAKIITYLAGLEKMFELSSIHYNISDFEDFEVLRKNPSLIEYSNCFSEQLESIMIEGKFNELDLLRKLLEVFETDEIKSKISNGLSIAASVAGILSLIALYSNPYTAVIGTAAGAAGVGADITSRVIQSNKNNSWIRLVPQINQTLTIRNIERKISELEKLDT